MSYERQGPPRLWQNCIYTSWMSVPPRSRLNRSGKYGIIVGKNSRLAGGLTQKSARRLFCEGIADLVYDDKGNIIKAYSRQYLLPFEGAPLWQRFSINYRGCYV